MEISFDKIWFIQSLKPQDRKTGTNIYHDSIDVAGANKINIEVIFKEVNSKEEFFNLLINIEGDVHTNGSKPLLHIDCHGDQDGIVMSNGERITWEELRPHLIRINQASRLNLVIVLSACEGVSLIMSMAKMDNCPFAAVIARGGAQYPHDLENDFTRFYQKLFTTLDFTSAFNSLNKDRIYNLLDAEHLFINAYIAYYRSYCRGAGKRKRKERLLTELKKKAPHMETGELRKILKNLLTTEEEQKQFEKKVLDYFFINFFPEIKERIKLDFEEIINTF